MNWEKEKLRQKKARDIRDALYDSYGKNQYYFPLPADLKTAFEGAFLKTTGTPDIAKIYSLKRYFMINGYLTVKQRQLLFVFASTKFDAPKRFSVMTVSCKNCGRMKSPRTSRDYYIRGFCTLRCLRRFESYGSPNQAISGAITPVPMLSGLQPASVKREKI